MSSPSERRRQGGVHRGFLVLVAMLGCGCEPGPATTAAECIIAPPRGPFDGAFTPAPPPPTSRELPTKVASSTLITPAPRHRWVPDGGMVETTDGTLLLHGIVAVAGKGPTDITITVLLDYAPVESRLRVWTPTRERVLGRADGAHRITVPLEDRAAAFDIELPAGTVSIGHWREVQTVVTVGDAAPDVRRWTLYAGAEPPAARACLAGLDNASDRPRSSLSTDGRYRARAAAPSTTLAVVGLDAQRAGEVQLVQLEEAGDGATIELGPLAEVAAVWESPMTGPGPSWISKFWSASKQSKAASNRDVR